MSAPRQERDRVDGARIAKLLAGVVVIAAIGVGFSSWLMGPPPRGPEPTESPRTIGSIEQTNVYDTAAGLDLRARQRAELETWHWVDRDAGIAAIPIERAMAIVGGAP